MSKPRQFWIIDETPYSTWVSSKPLYSADTKEEIHVIEFSAYQSAIEELKAARSELQAIAKNNCYDCACEAPAEDAVARIDKFLKENE